MSVRDDVLLELEWRHYRHFLPYSRKGALAWAGFMGAALIASLGFLDHSGSVESRFVLGFMFAAVIGSTLAIGQSMTIWESPFKDWWLALPYPRRSLIRAKALAAMRMQLHVVAALWLVCLLDGAVRSAAGSVPDGPVGAGRLIADALAYGALYAAAVPLFVGAGFALLGMYYGRRRWLLIPFLVFLMLPYGLFGFVSDGEATLRRWMSAEFAFLYALAALAVAWLVYHGMLRFVARYGMPELSRHRAGAASFTSKNGKEGRTGEGEAPRYRARGRGFPALYALERSRFRHFASMKAVRIVYGALLALLAIGGFFLSMYRDSMTALLQSLFIVFFVVPIPILGTLNQHEANKRRLDWWLCLPYGRTTLLWARLSAVWSSALRWIAGCLTAFYAGAFAQELALGRWDPSWRLDGVLLAYLVLVYLVGGFLLSCIMQGQPYSFRSRLATWVYTPLTFLLFFAPIAVNNWLVTDRVRLEGVDPYRWGLFGLIVLVGSPLAYAGFRTGAKWMHLYLLNTSDAVLRRRGAGPEGKI